MGNSRDVEEPFIHSEAFSGRNILPTLQGTNPSP